MIKLSPQFQHDGNGSVGVIVPESNITLPGVVRLSREGVLDANGVVFHSMLPALEDPQARRLQTLLGETFAVVLRLFPVEDVRPFSPDPHSLLALLHPAFTEAGLFFLHIDGLPPVRVETVSGRHVVRVEVAMAEGAPLATSVLRLRELVKPLGFAMQSGPADPGPTGSKQGNLPPDGSPFGVGGGRRCRSRRAAAQKFYSVS